MTRTPLQRRAYEAVCDMPLDTCAHRRAAMLALWQVEHDAMLDASIRHFAKEAGLMRRLFKR